MTTTDTHTATIHPAWCDPRRCSADEDFVADREHVSHGQDVELSLHDRSGEHCQVVGAYISQQPGDADPTFGIWSETAGNGRELGSGFQLRMTRPELIRLWTEMGRVIDATG